MYIFHVLRSPHKYKSINMPKYITYSNTWWYIYAIRYIVSIYDPIYMPSIRLAPKISLNTYHVLCPQHKYQRASNFSPLQNRKEPKDFSDPNNAKNTTKNRKMCPMCPFLVSLVHCILDICNRQNFQSNLKAIFHPPPPALHRPEATPQVKLQKAPATPEKF